jgi:AraC-like DNA-binding protein
MALVNHSSLSEYMAYLKSHYDIQICINDFVGFIPLDNELDHALQPYMAHTNLFCVYIKSDKKLMQKCQSMKRKLITKCNKEGKYFKGMCHAGATELIYPIFYDKQLLGVINVGMFSTSPAMSRYLIKRVCRCSELKEDVGIELFGLSTKVTLDSALEKELSVHFNFIASYLANCFGKLSAGYHAVDILKRKHNYNEDLVLSQCVQFIKKNYLIDIEVSMLQVLCHCSESYINHIFKKRTGYSVKGYVNRLRIEDAKELLLNTCISISEISLKVGFSDPDYFSRVFTKVIGISPRKYRDRLKRDPSPME